MTLRFKGIVVACVGCVLWSLFGPATAAEQLVPDCLEIFKDQILKGPLRLPKDRAYRLFRQVKGYNAHAQSGVLAVMSSRHETLDYEAVDLIIEHFAKASLDVNPLGSDEALFEVIGRLSPSINGELTMRDGLEKVVLDIARDRDNKEKGAAFSRVIAKQIAGPSHDYSRVQAFEHRLVAG